jgi:hypothetical protein
MLKKRQGVMRNKYFNVVGSIILVCAVGLMAGTVSHFTPVANSGQNMLVVVQTGISPTFNGLSFQVGDQIGVFTPGGLCVGAEAWTGSNIAITVWGADTVRNGPDIISISPGIGLGEQLKYRVWSAFRFKEEAPATVTYSGGFDGNYATDANAILASLTAVINTPPTNIGLSNSSVNENAGANAVVGALSATDAENDSMGGTFTYTLVTGTGDNDNVLFNISGNTLRATASLDFEQAATRSVRIKVTDMGDSTYSKVFTITVNNVNEAPINISLSNQSVNENAGADAAIGTLSATDLEGGTLTYTLVTGTGSTDNGLFNISGTTLQVTASLDYEQAASRSVRIQVADTGGLTYSKAFTITVINVNETPTDISLSNSTTFDNAAIGTTVGALSTTDPDNPGAGQTFTYTLVSGTGSTDNDSFSISGGDLKIAKVLSGKTSVSVRIRTTDQGAPQTPPNLWVEKVFAITVLHGNTAPTNISLSNQSVDENAGANAAVGTLSATDLEGGTMTYTLVSGTGSTDNNLFNISGTTLRATASLNFEQAASRSVRIQVADTGTLTYSKSFTITVINRNDAPTGIVLSNSNVNDNAAIGTVVGILSTIDQDVGQTYTYLRVGGADMDSFQIIGDTLKTARVLSYAGKNSLQVTIRTDDGTNLAPIHLTKDSTFTITVNQLPPDVPTLVSPGDGALDRPTSLTLTWNTAAGAASYHLQVSIDNAFLPGSEYAFNGNVGNTTSQAVSGLANGVKYYWHVEAHNGTGPSGYSTTRNFTTIPQARIPVKPGWNMVSCNIHPPDSSMPAIFGGLTGFVVAKNNSGKIFWPAFGINTIGTFRVVDGYKVNTGAVDTSKFLGTQVDVATSPINLAVGWNMISYLPQASMSIAFALATLDTTPISGKITIVKNNGGLIYWPDYGINGIKNMAPYEGYKIYMKMAAVLTYPASGPVLAKKTANAGQMVVELPLAKHYALSKNTGNNASILATGVTENGVPVADGSEVAAYDAEGNLVGSGVVMNGKTAFSVWGKDSQTKVKDGLAEGEVISLKLWNGSMEIPLEMLGKKMVYSEDGIFLGNLSVPGMYFIKKFALRGTYAGLNGQVRIMFDVPYVNGKDMHDVAINLYNVGGRLVGHIAAGRYAAGHYTVTWNGPTTGAGMYIARMKAENFDGKMRLMMVK